MGDSRPVRIAEPVVPIATVLFVAGAITLSGCPLVHPDSEPRRCLDNRDCFEQEGEFCDLPADRPGRPGTCRTRLDASSPDLSSPDLSGSRDTARPPDGAPGDVLPLRDGPPDGDGATTDLVTDGADPTDQGNAADQGEGMQ